MTDTNFEWDELKDRANQLKHGVSFAEAQLAFLDSSRVIVRDEEHSDGERRLFCIGEVDGDILTVRFTVRVSVIRIIGAGYWRKWRKFYYEQQKTH